MSLDVYLKTKEPVNVPSSSGIFVRRSGETREISREEWNAENPDRQVPLLDGGTTTETTTVFDYNITHNLGTMAREAGIYQHLWRPEELGITKANQLIVPLRAGLELLRSDRPRFEEFNPDNGWGNYDGLVRFVSNYADACEKYPEAEIEVSR